MFCSTASTATPSATRADHRGDERIDDRRCQAFGRLVHKEQLAVQHECPAHGEHLLLSPGQLASAVLASLSEPRKQLVYSLWRPSFPFGPVGQHPKVLVNGERGKETSALRHIADSGLRNLLGRQTVEHHPVEPHQPCAGSDETHQCLAERGLPHAVAPDDGHRLRAHREGDAVENPGLAVPGLQSINLQEVVGHRWPSLRFPQIDLVDHRVVTDLFGGPRHNHLAIGHDDDLLGRLERDIHVVLDQDQSEPLGQREQELREILSFSLRQT